MIELTYNVPIGNYVCRGELERYSDDGYHFIATISDGDDKIIGSVEIIGVYEEFSTLLNTTLKLITELKR